MAVVDLLNRRLSFVAAVFAFLGVIVGVVALATNYWTVINFTVPGTAAFTSNGTVLERGSVNFTWNGLFYQCTAGVDGCLTRFWATTFLLCLLGLIFLLVGGYFIGSFNRRHIRLWFMGTIELSFVTFNDFSRCLCLFWFTNHSIYCWSIFNIRSICCYNCNEWKLKLEKKKKHFCLCVVSIEFACC